MEYEYVSDMDMAVFNNKVNAKLDQGFKINGSQGVGEDGNYYQFMIRDSNHVTKLVLEPCESATSFSGELIVLIIFVICCIGLMIYIICKYGIN